MTRPTYKVTLNDSSVLELDRYDKSEVEELKARVRLGNEKLCKAWDQLVEMDHTKPEWDVGFKQWGLACDKLRRYCDQLQWLGFSDCVFIIEGKKTRRCLSHRLSCIACPSTNRSYWETEFAALPGESDKEIKTEAPKLL